MKRAQEMGEKATSDSLKGKLKIESVRSISRQENREATHNAFRRLLVQT